MKPEELKKIKVAQALSNSFCAEKAKGFWEKFKYEAGELWESDQAEERAFKSFAQFLALGYAMGYQDGRNAEEPPKIVKADGSKYFFAKK